MNDEQLETEVRSAVRSQAESVHPADRLGAIRARTRGGSTRAGASWWNRPWVLAAGTGLITASVVAAAVLLVDTSADAPQVAGGDQREVTVYEIEKVGGNWWLYPELVTVGDKANAEDDALVALEELAERDPGYVDECEIGLNPSSVSIGADVVTIHGQAGQNLNSFCAPSKAHIEARTQQLAWTVRSAIGWEGPVRVNRGPAVVADPNALSPIIIESPAGGSTVASPVTVSGTSDTFEANVVWEVTSVDAGGVGKGGTTMGGSYGERAPFEFTVQLPPGDYTARAYAESVEDGSLFAEDTVTFTVE